MAKFRRETVQGRVARQQALVDSIESNLSAEGYESGFIELLAVAFTTTGKDGGSGLQRLVEANRAQARDDLQKLYLAEADAHDKLHRLLGSPKSTYPRPFLNSSTTIPSLKRAPGSARAGARSVVADSMANASCRLRGKCTSVFKEVREHAKFARWLGAMAEGSGTAEMRREAPLEYPFESKGSILEFLRRDGATYDAIALFLYLRGEPKGVLPMSDDQLQKAAARLRQLPVDSRRRQKRGSDADACLTRSRGTPTHELIDVTSKPSGRGR